MKSFLYFLVFNNKIWHPRLREQAKIISNLENLLKKFSNFGDKLTVWMK